MFNHKLLSKTVLSSLIMGIVVGSLGGYMVASVRFSGGLTKTQTEKVRKLFPIMPEMRAISGTIKKIDGKTIKLEIAESSNPFDEWPTKRMVTVADETKIFRIDQKDPKELEKEMTAFRANIAARSSIKSSLPVIPPGPTKEVEIKLSDLIDGENITVLADHDIKMETEFAAIKITLGTGMPGDFVPPTLNP